MSSPILYGKKIVIASSYADYAKVSMDFHSALQTDILK